MKSPAEMRYQVESPPRPSAKTLMAPQVRQSGIGVLLRRRNNVSLRNNNGEKTKTHDPNRTTATPATDAHASRQKRPANTYARSTARAKRISKKPLRQNNRWRRDTGNQRSRLSAKKTGEYLHPVNREGEFDHCASRPLPITEESIYALPLQRYMLISRT